MFPPITSFNLDLHKKGEIEFRDLVMQYREDLPPVLKGLNVHIQPKEKIGKVLFFFFFSLSLKQVLYKKEFVEELAQERVRSFKLFSEWWKVNQVRF